MIIGDWLDATPMIEPISVTPEAHGTFRMCRHRREDSQDRSYPCNDIVGTGELNPAPAVGLQGWYSSTHYLPTAEIGERGFLA